MPNHIYQKIRISDWNYDGKIKEIKSKIFNKEGSFDFNLLIPQPITIFSGNLGEKERQMCLSEGRPNWYDWNTENWKTKWNAYGFELIEDDEDTLTFNFQTAWNIPEPIIEKLIEISKGCNINYVAVDEGGYFATQIIVDENGKIETKDLKEACDALLFTMSN